jgi:hypothetical protein
VDENLCAAKSDNEACWESIKPQRADAGIKPNHTQITGTAMPSATC